jgi:rare lipoprotein A
MADNRVMGLLSHLGQRPRPGRTASRLPIALYFPALLALSFALAASGCARTMPITSPPVETGAPQVSAETGVASYYAHQHDGQRTASGERFDMHALTAAHRTLPFGTRVRVTNLGNGRSVEVRINDRGPFIKARVLDVSYAAAQELRMIRSGTARVRLDVVPPETD